MKIWSVLQMNSDHERKGRNCPAYFRGHMCKITSEGGYLGYNNSALMRKPFTGDMDTIFSEKAIYHIREESE